MKNIFFLGILIFSALQGKTQISWLWRDTAQGEAHAGRLGNADEYMAVDASGNLYFTGMTGYIPLTFGTITLPNSSSREIFLTKYTPSGIGNIHLGGNVLSSYSMAFGNQVFTISQAGSFVANISSS